MKRQQERVKRSTRLTTAGLIGVTAGTLLMMAWAIFPNAALADDPFPWGGQGFPNATCNAATAQTMLWIFNDNGTAVPTSLTINGQAQSGSWVQKGGGTYQFTATVNGTNFPPTTASVTFSGTLGTNTVLTLSGCNEGQTTTTTTTSPPTTTTTTTSTTTSPPTTTTTTTSTTTSTTATSTSSTPPGGTTTTTQSSTTTSPTVGPTTVQPSGSDTETVSPTTVRPGKLAFTGIEDVIPIGALALTLMTTGSGLLWAGARRRRSNDPEDEN